MRFTLSTARPSHVRHFAGLTLCLASVLSACGGGSGTEPGQVLGAKNHAAEPLITESSIALQAQGTGLNALELQEAQAEAASLPADTTPTVGKTAPLAAYQSGAIAQKAAAIQMPVYRFYNTLTGTHFYTSSIAERDAVKANMAFMNDEGIAFFAASEPSPGLKPVYRLYRSAFGAHFYTISETERDIIQEQLLDTRYEGIAYYASPVAGVGFSPLYRFFWARVDKFFGYHFYTSSESERQHLQENLNATYAFEGVGYYVLNTPAP